MTTCDPLSDNVNPIEGGIEKAKRLVIGSCVICWAVVGLLVIAGSLAKLFDLI